MRSLQSLLRGSKAGASGSKPRSISSKGSRHTHVSGASSNVKSNVSRSAHAPRRRSEEPLGKIIEDVAEETEPNELAPHVDQANAGASEWYNQPCAIFPQLACVDPVDPADGDLAGGDLEASSEPFALGSRKHALSGECCSQLERVECDDALQCDENAAPAAADESECKFLKNSTIDARSLAEISEISHGWPLGFRFHPSSRWGSRFLKANEEDEPITHTIGRFSSMNLCLCLKETIS